MRDKNFIFDFETLGTDLIRGFPVLDVSYMTFDANRFTSDNPYTFDELVEKMQYAKFDVADYCKRFGYKPEKSTIEWWSSQSKEAQSKIKPDSQQDVTVEEFADQFIEYLNNNRAKFWWTRGNVFDPIVAYRLFSDIDRSQEFNTVCPHWAVRDMRTFIDTHFDFDKSIQNGFVLPEWEDKMVKHNSKHDVAADILRAQKIIRSINDE